MEAYKHAIACAWRGDLDFFKTVASEILLKQADDADRSVLSVAAWEGHLDCCEVIVQRCPQLLYHQDDDRKWSVLHTLAQTNSANNNLENIMRFLLFTADSKPDLELGGGPKIPNYTLLTMQDYLGRTALHWAVIEGNHGATKLLLEADRDFRLRRMVINRGETCLHLALNSGDQDMVKLICEADLDKQLLSMPDADNNTPLHLAIDNAAARGRYDSDSLVTCKLLLEKDPSQYTKLKGDKWWTLFHLAAASDGLNSVVMDMIRLCSDCINTVDFHGQNVLHIAAYHGHLAVVQQFLQSKEDTNVALFNSQDEDGNTPLHLAVYKGNVQVVRLLLEAPHMSEHKATNISTKTPYMMGMRKILSHKYGECSKSDSKADLELGGGANIPNKKLLTVQNKYGDTALHLAVAKRNHEVTKLLLEADCEFELLPMVDNHGRTCLHIAAYRGDHESAKLIIQAKPDDEFLKMTTTHLKQTALHIATLRILSDKCGEYSKSGSKIFCMLLEKDPKQCIELVETHKQTFIHAAAKLGLNDVVENILKLKEIEATVLNIQDEDGNTPLHIAAFGQNKCMTLCLLYDARVSKDIENNKKEKAIDLISFLYDQAKARVYSLGHQSDLKDQSSFDLLVAALIATVSFTAGITVPGGYVSDGTNKGSAILLKATSFKVFVISNTIALLFSLYTVFLNFSTRRLLKEDDIYYESKTGTFRTRLLLKKKDMIFQLNAATLCTLSAVYAMVVAFITGSHAVLANSDGLAITVCVCSCFFLILVSHATWTMVMQYWPQKVEHEVSS